MPVGPLADLLLRKVPDALALGVQSGELKVYGSIIRSLTSGHIVGHLQETSAFANLVGNLALAPASLPLQAGGAALDAVGHSIMYAQNERLKAAIAAVQSLQISSVALGAATIGVSVAGFAVLSRKLDRVQAKVDELDCKLRVVAKGIDLIRSDRVTEDFVRLRTAIEQVDEGWLLSDGTSQWQRVASEAHFLANQFEQRAAELLEAGIENLSLAEPFLDALELASNARITARMAAGDDSASAHSAAESLTALIRLGETVALGTATLAALNGDAVPATFQWQEALESTANSFRPAVERVRTREAAAAATCLTIDEVRKQQISTREWLETARDEQETPFLFLPVAQAPSQPANVTRWRKKTSG